MFGEHWCASWCWSSSTRQHQIACLTNLSHHTSSVLYNWYMSGVDRGNQLQQYWSVHTKSHKMYKYIFQFIFDVTITNAYVLYQFIPQMDRKALPLKEFQTKIARKLIGNYNSRKQVGRPRQMPLPRISAGIQTLSHFPRKIQKENAMLATPLGIAMNVRFGFATAGLTVTASCCTTSRSSCTTEWLSYWLPTYILPSLWS